MLVLSLQYTYNYLNIIILIYRSPLKLVDLSDSSSGIKEYEIGKGKPPQTEDNRINKIFNSNEMLTSTYKKHIQGNDVSKYQLDWKGGYLNYGEWIAAPREQKYFEGERIIIREIPSKNRLICAFTEEDFTVKNTAHIFKMNKEYHCKFIVALLNSKLMGYYFVNKFSERDNVFPKAKLGQCRLLPIKNTHLPDQQPFIDKVSEILTLKKANPQADTLVLEAAIDTMVYELYGLNDDEIKIVENS